MKWYKETILMLSVDEMFFIRGGDGIEVVPDPPPPPPPPPPIGTGGKCLVNLVSASPLPCYIE